MATSSGIIFQVATVLILALPACTNSNQSPRARGATDREGCAWPASLDAVAAAPGNHRVLLENDRVRVLEITVAPGEREPVHAHCLPSVSYVMYEGKYRDYDGQGNLLSEGKESPPESQFPMTSWSEPVAPHSFENLDTKPVRSLHIELKH
jgi:hypothetical protein